MTENKERGYTIDNHEHAYFTNSDGQSECNHCGLLESTIKATTPNNQDTQPWEKEWDAKVALDAEDDYGWHYDAMKDGLEYINDDMKAFIREVEAEAERKMAERYASKLKQVINEMGYENNQSE